VPLEFEARETWENLPLDERLSIVLVSNGSASLSLNEKTVTLAAPCIVLLSPYDTVKIIESTRFAAKTFSFHPQWMNSALTFERLKANDFSEMEDEHDRNMMNLFLCKDEHYNGAISLPAQTYLRISEWLAIMGVEVYAQSDGYWSCRIRRYLLQILYLLDDIYMEQKAKNSEKREKSPVDSLLEYIHVNYSDEISLDDLCQHVHVNRVTLNRQFKAQAGCTAMEYLNKHRLKIACETLAHTNLSIAEISEAIGFKYDTYFIKQFTVKMGESPTEYRRRYWG
jgi:YesN/AraC family two-component response regulator